MGREGRVHVGSADGRRRRSSVRRLTSSLKRTGDRTHSSGSDWSTTDSSWLVRYVSDSSIGAVSHISSYLRRLRRKRGRPLQQKGQSPGHAPLSSQCKQAPSLNLRFADTVDLELPKVAKPLLDRGAGGRRRLWVILTAKASEREKGEGGNKQAGNALCQSCRQTGNMCQTWSPGQTGGRSERPALPEPPPR